MTAKEINKLYEKKNLTELLSYTLVGLSATKERFKKWKTPEVLAKSNVKAERRGIVCEKIFV